jgi:CRP/FNR family transcriptional regulator, cyclic AMP receptor protein
MEVRRVANADQRVGPGVSAYCVADRLDALDRPAWGAGPPPWAPGRREEVGHVERAVGDGGVLDERLALLSKIDILADLSEAEMHAIVEAAPARTFAAGELLYTPHRPVEALFLLKRGRIRVFRISADGRALTTAIVTPGRMFGEMALLGQRMYDNYAEALDDAFTCVMDRAEVHRLLLSDPRIAARIVEILGQRLVEMERRLSDTVFKSVSQRIAAALCALVADAETPGSGSPRGPRQIALTHEQIAALVGTSRRPPPKPWASSPSRACSDWPAARSPLWIRRGLAPKPATPEPVSERHVGRSSRFMP